MTIELRDYQKRTNDKIRELALSGHRRILTVMPTGAGKTHTMADIALGSINKGHKVLCLMHRRGLVDQMMQRFNECGIENGRIMAGVDHSLDSQCQIASLWTYSRRIKIAEKQYNPYWVDAPVILIDEAHHVLNNTYKKILGEYPNAFVIGCTATPTLSTGAGLGQYFDSMVDVVTMDELLNGGHLVPGEYYGPSEPDLSKIPELMGDYTQKGLDKLLNNKKIIGDVVDNWFEYARDTTTMVFAINRKHARALCVEFNNRGVAAEYLDAFNNDDERDDVLCRLENGATRIVCQVALYTEGTDLPFLQTLSIARPTKSLGLHRQILGRGARPFPGKESFMVLDHGGNVKRLGYYEDEIAWTLKGKKHSNQPKQVRKKEKTILTCDYCHSLITGKRCPKCGNEIKNYGKKVEAAQAQLIHIGGKAKKKTYSMDEKREWYQMLDYERRMRGYSLGWTAHKFKSKFGCWPKGMRDLPPKSPTNEVSNWIKYQRIKWAKSRKTAAYM